MTRCFKCHKALKPLNPGVYLQGTLSAFEVHHIVHQGVVTVTYACTIY